MRTPLVALAACLATAGVALTACPNTCQAPAGGAAAPCKGGCGCGGGCYCGSAGGATCNADVACLPTCLDDGGTNRYPGNNWVSGNESCACDYSGNINCCPLDGGGCTNACLDANANFRQVDEVWVAPDGGSCTCRTGFVLDCGRPPAPAHCSFAGRGYLEGAKVDAGAACTCTCNAQGHLTCPSTACLPTSCADQGNTWSTGLIFPTGCNFCLCGDDGALACSGRVCAGGRCEYAGTTFDAGATFPSADGCNTCQCTDAGTSNCTTNACAAVHCVVDGGAVAVGTTFLTADRCNVCGCSSDGKVYCTARPCTP